MAMSFSKVVGRRITRDIPGYPLRLIRSMDRAVHRTPVVGSSAEYVP